MKLFSKIKNRLQNLPVAYTGLALGVGGFGNVLVNFFSIFKYDAKWITIITMSLLSLFLIVILLKNLFHPKVLNYELKQPLLMSLLPTFSMSLMLVAGFIGMWDTSSRTNPNQIAAGVTMCIAVFIQLCLIFFFFKNLYVNHIKSKENPIYGTYFVPFVGLITSCTVASNVISLPSIFFEIIWYFGYLSFLVTIPIFTYSIVFSHKKVGTNEFATIAVWFAPPNLACSGFINTFLLMPKDLRTFIYPEPFLNTIFIITLMLGFTTSLMLYFVLFRIFSLHFQKNFKNFSPILCSISFPCAISAMAATVGTKYLANEFVATDIQFIISFIWCFFVFSIIFIVLTLVIILYLVSNMLVLLYKMLFSNSSEYDKKHIAYFEQR